MTEVDQNKVKKEELIDIDVRILERSTILKLRHTTRHTHDRNAMLFRSRQYVFVKSYEQRRRQTRTRMKTTETDHKMTYLITVDDILSNIFYADVPGQERL